MIHYEIHKIKDLRIIKTLITEEISTPTLNNLTTNGMTRCIQVQKQN
jgi:hypothetical protein